MSTEQIFNRNTYGLWRELTGFAQKQNVTITPNEATATLSVKGVSADAPIGEIQSTEPGRFMFSYRQKDGGIVSFSYNTHEIPMFMRTLQRRVDTALDPKSTYNGRANVDLTTVTSGNRKLLDPDLEITISLNGDGGFTLREHAPQRPGGNRTNGRPEAPNSPV